MPLDPRKLNCDRELRRLELEPKRHGVQVLAAIMLNLISSSADDTYAAARIDRAHLELQLSGRYSFEMSLSLEVFL
jgi:hypothetical protein